MRLFKEIDITSLQTGKANPIYRSKLRSGASHSLRLCSSVLSSVTVCVICCDSPPVQMLLQFALSGKEAGSFWITYCRQSDAVIRPRYREPQLASMEPPIIQAEIFFLN